MSASHPLAESQRRLIGESQGWACYYCREQGTTEHDFRNHHWEYDHIVPASRGGSHKANNRALACGWCNSRKKALSEAEFRERLPQLLAHRPAKLTGPVKFIRWGEFYFLDDGTPVMEYQIVEEVLA